MSKRLRRFIANYMMALADVLSGIATILRRLGLKLYGKYEPRRGASGSITITFNGEEISGSFHPTNVPPPTEEPVAESDELQWVDKNGVAWRVDENFNLVRVDDHTDSSL